MAGANCKFCTFPPLTATKKWQTDNFADKIFEKHTRLAAAWSHKTRDSSAEMEKEDSPRITPSIAVSSSLDAQEARPLGFPPSAPILSLDITKYQIYHENREHPSFCDAMLGKHDEKLLFSHYQKQGRLN